MRQPCCYITRQWCDRLAWWIIDISDGHPGFLNNRPDYGLPTSTQMQHPREGLFVDDGNGLGAGAGAVLVLVLVLAGAVTNAGRTLQSSALGFQCVIQRPPSSSARLLAHSAAR